MSGTKGKLDVKGRMSEKGADRVGMLLAASKFLFATASVMAAAVALIHALK